MARSRLELFEINPGNVADDLTVEALVAALKGLGCTLGDVERGMHQTAKSVLESAEKKGAGDSRHKTAAGGMASLLGAILVYKLFLRSER